MKHKAILHSLGHAVLVIIYVAFVAWFMRNAQTMFGFAANDNQNGVWGGVFFLTLFVISAAITGALVLGRPILLYLDSKKKEALQFFGYTLGWLVAIMIALVFLQPWR